MRPDLLSRRGPGGRSTSASALRPAAAAAISVGVGGGTPPRQPRSGTRGVWPQRVCWLVSDNASGASCRRAPTVAPSAFSRSPVRGGTKEPPRRLAKHRRVCPHHRGGVTAPPSKTLTKGGESQGHRCPVRARGRARFHTRPRALQGSLPNQRSCVPEGSSAPSRDGDEPARPPGDGRRAMTERRPTPPCPRSGRVSSVSASASMPWRDASTPWRHGSGLWR